MPTVAVVGSEADPHTRYVADAVARAGGRSVILETRPFPARTAISWRSSSLTGDPRLRWGSVAVDDVDAVFIKQVHLAVAAPGLDDIAQRRHASFYARYLAERERHAMLMGALRDLAAEPGRRVVNPVDRFELHTSKPLQMAALDRAGFPIPETLVTSDPDAVRAFAARHREVIKKPISGGAVAEILTEGDLESGALAALRDCPALLQERIVGPEARAYVLDDAPVAAFDVPTVGAIDARANLDRVTPVELDDLAWQLCLDASRALGLVFCAVDLRRDAEGRWVLLELNPAPAIAFHDDPVDGAVITALADFLVGHG